jgi:hypothetical protein
MMFLNELCGALDRNNVRYALAGGYAVALHGAVRGTVVIDLVINWNLKNIRSAETALQELGLVSRLPITADDVFGFRDEYIRNRNLVAWNFYHPEDASRLVDIIITDDLKGKRRQTFRTLDGPVQVLGIRDLIKMKRAGGRPQDLADIEALEKLL